MTVQSESVRTREKNKESYQETVFLFNEHRYETAVWMKTISPGLTVTGKPWRIAFVPGGDFIDGREGVLVLHDWNWVKAEGKKGGDLRLLES